MTAILLLTSALLLTASAVCMAWMRVAATAEQRHDWDLPVASGTGNGGRDGRSR